MYKVTIQLSDWDWAEGETLAIETCDFDKVQIIQEFIEMQKEYGWAVDYQPIEYVEVDEDGLVYDEDYDVWCMCDSDTGVWYWFDEESDEWVEVEEVEDEEVEDEDEDEGSTVTTYVITHIEE
jgi:hypothetical protein